MSKDFEFDEDDDAPRSKRRPNDDKDDAPRPKRRRDSEDDEAPRPKRRRDSEDDEAPRSRRNRSEEPRNSRRDRSDYDEDDAPRTRRVDRDKPRTSPLRFVSPGTFGIAVLFFFLPWTDLSCNGPTGKMQIVTQSGFQSARGEYSEGDGLSQMREKEEKKMGKKVDAKLDLRDLQRENFGNAGNGPKQKDGPEKAPLLWIYLVVLIVGVIVPVLLAAKKPRAMVVISVAWFAILMLVVQLIVGFPLANTAADSNAKNQKMAAPAADMNVIKLDGLEDAMKLNSSFLPFFWLTMVVLIASCVVGVVDLFVGRPTTTTNRRRNRRPRDDEFDDDDED